MTPTQAIKARNYVQRYGKDWTAKQVAAFFVEVARLCAPAVDTTSSAQEN